MAIALVLIASVVPALAWDADGDVVEERTVYCYGDDPIIVPIIGTSDDHTWTVTSGGEAFADWEYRDGADDGSIVLHLAGHDQTVTVRQTVGDEAAIVNIIPLHLPLYDEDGDDRHVVTFHDGTRVFDRFVIERTMVVDLGSDHVAVPADPAKEGYEFDGWYTDPSFSDGSEFDPSMPVYGNVDVYAKWTGAGSGDTVVTVPEYILTAHVVTFETVVGLEYDIVESGSTFVSFTVGTVGGYRLVDGTLSVTSDGGTIVESDGVYTLYGITTDVVVSIDGTVTTTTGSADGTLDHPAQADDGGFPWWVLAVVLVLVVAVLAIWVRRGHA